jgi:hypothetical protein
MIAVKIGKDQLTAHNLILSQAGFVNHFKIPVSAILKG